MLIAARRERCARSLPWQALSHPQKAPGAAEALLRAAGALEWWPSTGSGHREGQADFLRVHRVPFLPAALGIGKTPSQTPAVLGDHAQQAYVYFALSSVWPRRRRATRLCA
ncbi:unnamed protein product [Prorocentrum cordatum]|uniref:Uncharacterized protein n=1 Tax=Prorocentrum cordatum TaxID=2364126 RepID=A0ABN9U6M9_9DINO|nr:unnamed protein product [Polarella glacialis]